MILTILHSFSSKKNPKAGLPSSENESVVQDKIIEKCLDIAKKIVFDACKDKQSAKLPKEIKSADLSSKKHDLVLENYFIIGSPNTRIVRKESITHKCYSIF
jgi:hypothetical protein